MIFTYTTSRLLLLVLVLVSTTIIPTTTSTPIHESPIIKSSVISHWASFPTYQSSTFFTKRKYLKRFVNALTPICENVDVWEVVGGVVVDMVGFTQEEVVDDDSDMSSGTGNWSVQEQHSDQNTATFLRNTVDSVMKTCDVVSAFSTPSTKRPMKKSPSKYFQSLTFSESEWSLLYNANTAFFNTTLVTKSDIQILRTRFTELERMLMEFKNRFHVRQRFDDEVDQGLEEPTDAQKKSKWQMMKSVLGQLSRWMKRKTVKMFQYVFKRRRATSVNAQIREIRGVMKQYGYYLDLHPSVHEGCHHHSKKKLRSQDTHTSQLKLCGELSPKDESFIRDNPLSRTQLGLLYLELFSRVYRLRCDNNDLDLTLSPIICDKMFPTRKEKYDAMRRLEMEKLRERFAEDKEDRDVTIQRMKDEVGRRFGIEL